MKKNNFVDFEKLAILSDELLNWIQSKDLKYAEILFLLSDVKLRHESEILLQIVRDVKNKEICTNELRKRI